MASRPSLAIDAAMQKFITWFNTKLAYGGIILNEDRFTRTAQLGLNSLRQTINAHDICTFSTTGAFTGAGGILYTLAN